MVRERQGRGRSPTLATDVGPRCLSRMLVMVRFVAGPPVRVILPGRPEVPGCAVTCSRWVAARRSAAPSGRSLRIRGRDQDRIRLARRRAQEAANLQNEVAGDLASNTNALEAHRKEDSHEPCCHRSRRQGIPYLHPSTGRSDRG